MKRILIILCLILLLLAFPLYQLFALNSVEIKTITIDNFGMNSNLFFTIDGSVEAYNPSFIPVTIKKIDYEGYIEEEKVLEGTLEGQIIPAEATATFPFDEEIEWAPTPDTALAIIDGSNLTLTLKMNPQVSYLYLFTITGEKEADINIAALLKPYVQQQIAALNEMVLGFLK